MKDILLFGLYDTALMTAKCFNRKVYSIYGMDYNKNNSGFYSRFIKSVSTPNPNINESDWIRFVLAWLNKTNKLFFLIPTSDEFVQLAAKYSNELSTYCTCIQPDYSSVSKIVTRDVQFQMASDIGLNVPFFVKEKNQLKKELGNNLKFPLAIKPVYVVEWKQAIKEKVIVVRNSEELYKNLHKVESKGVNFLIQNIITGDNNFNYEVNSLLLPNGDVFQHTIKKLRQYPDGFGTATCIETVIQNELENSARLFIQKYNLIGFSNIEFKYNALDKKFYYIETNIRVWLQINFSKNCGINFPAILIDYINNSRQKPRTNLKNNGKWVDFFPDLLFWKKYHKKYGISLPRFVWSWFPIAATNLFSISDPLPFIKDLNLTKRLFRIIKRS